MRIVAVCQNRGNCQDLLNAFNCTCAGGWAGPGCQTEINECASNPCAPGATCLEHLNGFSCDACTSAPCQNGGSCSSLNDAFSDYACQCPEGFAGLSCETSVGNTGLSPAKVAAGLVVGAVGLFVLVGSIVWCHHRDNKAPAKAVDASAAGSSSVAAASSAGDADRPTEMAAVVVVETTTITSS